MKIGILLASEEVGHDVVNESIVSNSELLIGGRAEDTSRARLPTGCGTGYNTQSVK